MAADLAAAIIVHIRDVRYSGAGGVETRHVAGTMNPTWLCLASGKVREGAVGFRHLVGVFLLFDCGTLIVVGFD